MMSPFSPPLSALWKKQLGKNLLSASPFCEEQLFWGAQSSCALYTGITSNRWRGAIRASPIGHFTYSLNRYRVFRAPVPRPFQRRWLWTLLEIAPNRERPGSCLSTAPLAKRLSPAPDQRSLPLWPTVTRFALGRVRTRPGSAGAPHI